MEAQPSMRGDGEIVDSWMGFQGYQKGPILDCTGPFLIIYHLCEADVTSPPSRLNSRLALHSGPGGSSHLPG